MNLSTQVLIIGAGPTGLSMAVELHRLNIPFRIIDKKTKPVATSNALAVQPRTLEIWDDFEIVNKAIEKGIKIHGLHLYSIHKEILNLDFNSLKSQFQYILALPQNMTETLLIEYLAAKNIFVDMETNIDELNQNKDSITATLTYNDGKSEKLTAQWLIACDGAHSFVREKCQMQFEGEDFPQHFILADAQVNTALSKDTFNLITSPKGMLAVLRYDEKYFRILLDVTHIPEFNKKNPTLHDDEIRKMIASRFSQKIEINDIIWKSSFWIHARMVNHFKKDRIFFAGDAAHIHSPAGGQGMNTGIQDANNLAWKLAFVINGKARPDILDTYDLERKKVVKKVLKNTTFLTKMITMQNPILQTLRNFLIPTFMRLKFIYLIAIHTLTQLNIQYPENLLVKDFLSHKKGPKAGTRFLNVILENGSLLDFVRGTKMSLLFFTGPEDNIDLTIFYDIKNNLTQQYGDEFNFILIKTHNDPANWDAAQIWDKEQKIHQKYGAEDACLYLIRPDKYIGFRSDATSSEKLYEWIAKILYRNDEEK